MFVCALQLPVASTVHAPCTPACTTAACLPVGGAPQVGQLIKQPSLQPVVAELGKMYNVSDLPTMIANL